MQRVHVQRVEVRGEAAGALVAKLRGDALPAKDEGLTLQHCRGEDRPRRRHITLLPLPRKQLPPRLRDIKHRNVALLLAAEAEEERQPQTVAARHEAGASPRDRRVPGAASRVQALPALLARAVAPEVVQPTGRPAAAEDEDVAVLGVARCTHSMEAPSLRPHSAVVLELRPTLCVDVEGAEGLRLSGGAGEGVRPSLAAAKDKQPGAEACRGVAQHRLPGKDAFGSPPRSGRLQDVHRGIKGVARSVLAPEDADAAGHGVHAVRTPRQWGGALQCQTPPATAQEAARHGARRPHLVQRTRAKKA
mmetsp:Transcript_24231/g.76838  ORF Transcript_24231/g.76838 Transcript_24231/m.76838 type:complete len:305 (-) Transcript_24231:7-921(-)